MKTRTYSRAVLLVVSIALVAFQSTILQAQRDFSTASTAVTQPIPSDPNTVNGSSTTGKATTTARPNSSDVSMKHRKSIQGTDPKKVVSASAPTVKSKSPAPNSVMPAAVTNASATQSGGSQIKQAGYVDGNQGINRDGLDPLTAEPKSFRMQQQPEAIMTQPDRGAPPGIVGRQLGLIGTTSAEQLIFAKQAQAEAERACEQLRQELQVAHAKQKEYQSHLFVIVRELQAAKKELVQARTDFEKVRGEVGGLHEKIKKAEREHANFLQSMGPLIKQLLDPDEVSVLPGESEQLK